MDLGHRPVLLSMYALSGLITMFVLSRILSALMPTTFQSLSLGTHVRAQNDGASDQGYMPPIKTAVNDLDNALTASGVYGFIFNTSQTRFDVLFVTYNWCNMPHVRKDEYMISPAEYGLKFVEVIHRHHKRKFREL